MPKAVDLSGRKFGRLTVCKRDKDRKRVHWICECDCGKEVSVRADSLVKGITKSCGCLQVAVQVEDLTGQTFERLTVVKRTDNPAHRANEHHAYWLCECTCGNTHIARSADLKGGKVKSCGCLSKDVNTLHGKRRTKIYTTWCRIKVRCFNQNHPDFPDYGGRGITVYPLWKDDFQQFYDYISALPHYGEKGYSIDRIDVNGNYEPGNVRWANNGIQANNKRNNHMLTCGGKTQTIAQWAEEIGISKSTLYSRILTYHWPIEKALKKPVDR